MVTVSNIGTPSNVANAPIQIAVGTTVVPILEANNARKECIVINTGKTVIFLGLGRTPSTTVYHISLNRGAANNDGTGGVYLSDIWKGDIFAIGSAASGTVVVTELV